MDEQHDSGNPGIPADIRSALDALARLTERHAQAFRASVLLVSEDGRSLRDCAGPRLPTAYRAAIDGAAIGEGEGSCGTAAYRKKRVVVADIEHDPLWQHYRAAALPHGLRACWSEPILARDGAVLGTFALYYDQPREPSDAELRLIETAAARAAAMLDPGATGADAEDLVRALRQAGSG